MNISVFLFISWNKNNNRNKPMINYIFNNKVLNLNVLINTLTAYMLLGFLDDLVIPNIQYIFRYNRFCMKLSVWVLVIGLCCFFRCKIN